MADSRLRTALPRGITLRDPLLLASGCCGYGEEYAELVDPASHGGVITKAVSPEPRAGNPTPRLCETPAGLLNCIGLQNPGVEAFAAEIMPRLTARGTSFIVNAVGHSPEEFARVVARVEQVLASDPACAPRLSAEGVNTGLCGYELDLSCPNVESGTLFATDETVLARTVELGRRETERLLVAKLSPNVTDIVPFARCAREAGADAVTIANTFNGVSIDIATRQSNLARPSAGLSGPAIRAATLYHVWRCHRALPELPILGSGGITDADSAVQFLLAGATALQLGTGLFLNPRLVPEIQAGLSAYLDAQAEPDLRAIIGTYRDQG
ncbi:dihydroorotate dehydrogenase [bacterium]|nr:dihydroorotate dehydrogenase [bacterium]